MSPSSLTPDPFTDTAPISVSESRCKNPGLSAALREDPMYQTPWVGESAASWLSRGKADLEYERFDTAYPPSAILDKREARDHVAAQAPIAAAAIGALAAHGTCTVEQLAAFVGIEASDLIASDVLQALWSMSALKVGRVHSAREAFWERTLWTIDDKQVIYKDVLPLLSGAEALAMTAGQPIHVSQGHDRHAVLTAEVGLRVAEVTPVSTVLGERLSELKSMTDNHTTRRRGDLTAVRPDGLRIVFEVVAHDNQDFDSKAEFWAEQLATPGRGYGMTMVVFVVAADPDSNASRARGLPRRVSAAIVKARAKHGNSWRGYGRMGFVSWQDWFPAAGEMTNAFSSLTVRFPGLTPNCGSALDWTVVPATRSGDAEYTAVIENASLLAQTPAWLRSTPQAMRVLHRMGLPRLRGLPSPPLAKPDRPRSPRKSRGAAGPAEHPMRLLGIPGEHIKRGADKPAPAPAPAPSVPSSQPRSTPRVVRRRKPATPATLNAPQQH